MATINDRQPILVIGLLLIVSRFPVTSSLGTAHEVEENWFSVPSSVFTSAVRSAINEIQTATSFITKFAGKKFGDFRLRNAFTDCADLLDFSTDELTWTLSTTQNASNSNLLGTGNRVYDLKAWLSAAMDNQETCLDGFEGTKGVVKSIVAHSLSEVSSMMARILKMVKDGITPNTTTVAGEAGGFPEWVAGRERRLLQAPAAGLKVDVTVAQDGTGDFVTVTDAVNAAPENSGQRFVIYVKRGVYNENVEIKKNKWNLMVVGDEASATIISGDRSFVDGWTTFRTATFAVSGRGFIARDVTFENTAGPTKHQAVALRSDSDLSVFYRCGVHGYQDTLYAHSLRQFYKECHISGTVDFIFGNAAAIFQTCQVLARKPLPDQKNSVTAQGRKDPNQSTGFSLQFCNFSADPDLAASPDSSTPTYLGRPWKQYSRTVVMQSYLSGVIRPEGWLEWSGDFALGTLYYAEYMNFGPGAALGSRVRWSGYHSLADSTEANNFTVAQFIAGNLWLPATGVKYISGLTG